MSKQKVPRGRIVKRRWWALVRGPKRLPVIFGSRQDAIENADPDEQLVHVTVTPVTTGRTRR